MDKTDVADARIKLLDILNYPGGCISGPGIKSTLTLKERRQKMPSTIMPE